MGSSPRIHSFVRLLLVLAVASATLVPAPARAATGGPRLARRDGRAQRALTFEERVAYQRAIEEVYWRHKIWPAENAGPKPSLDEVMPLAAVRDRVEDALRASSALEAVGLYHQATSTLFLKNSNAPGPADLVFSFGPGTASWRPLVGDWNADGRDTIGLYSPDNGAFFLENANAAGPADVVFTFGEPGAGSAPLVGARAGRP